MIIDKKKEFKINTVEAQDDVPDDDPNARETWAHPCEFFLSCLGYAVGYGNIWRFPYLCFKNGGAAFLIPYFIMLLVAGIPMFFMELALGQYASLGAGVLFPEIAPIMTGIGWAMLATGAMITIFYNVVFAWSLFYTFSSFQSVLPWSHCNNDFNSLNCFSYDGIANCRNMSMYFFNRTCHSIEDFCDISHLSSYNESHCYNGTNGSEIIPAEKAVQLISSTEDFYRTRMLGMPGTTWENMGGMNWELAGCLFLAWALVAVCMFKGIKSSGKAIYFFALFPYLVLVIFLIRGLTLEGAYDGIQFYILQPNITKLKEIQVWNDAATQIFYSLGIAYGTLITLASYNKLNNNCMRDAIAITLSNSLTSVFAGFVIFSVLGFMAHDINVPVKDVADSGSGLAFIAYPAAISRMPYPAVFSVLFFTMLISIGIDSQFSFVETLAAGIFDSFESLRSKKPYVMVALCFVLFVLGLPFCLNGGIYLFELINTYAAGVSVLFIAVLEVICIAYVYGFQKFMKNIRKDMGIHVPTVLYDYWAITWQFFTPAILLAIFALGIYYFQPVSWGSYVLPPEAQFLGWMMTVGSIAPIPIFAVIVYCRSGKRGKELLTPSDQFCPAIERYKNRTKSKEAFNYIYDNEGFSPDNIAKNSMADAITSSQESFSYGIVPILKINSCDIEDSLEFNGDIAHSNVPDINPSSNQSNPSDESHSSKDSEENGDYYVDYPIMAKNDNVYVGNENSKESNSFEKDESKENNFIEISPSEDNSQNSDSFLKQDINLESFLHQNINHSDTVCKEIDLDKSNCQEQIENETDGLVEYEKISTESKNQSTNTSSNQSFSELNLNSDINSDNVSREINHTDDIPSDYTNIDNSFEVSHKIDTIIDSDEDGEMDDNHKEIHLDNDESKYSLNNHGHSIQGMDKIEDYKSFDSNTASDSVPELILNLDYNNENSSENIIYGSNEYDNNIFQDHISQQSSINMEYKNSTDNENYSEKKVDTGIENIDQLNGISSESIRRNVPENDFDIELENKSNVYDSFSNFMKEILSTYEENNYQEEINAKEEIAREYDSSSKCIKEDLDNSHDHVSFNINMILENDMESQSKYSLNGNDNYNEIKSPFDEISQDSNQSPECIKKHINYSPEHVGQSSNTSPTDKNYDSASSATKSDHDNANIFGHDNANILEEIIQVQDSSIVCINKNSPELVNSIDAQTLSHKNNTNISSEQNITNSNSSSECNFDKEI